MSTTFRHKYNSKRLAPKMKRCCKCSRMKNVSKFYTDTSKKDQLTTQCQTCIRSTRKDYYYRVEKKRPAPNEEMDIVHSSRKF